MNKYFCVISFISLLTTFTLSGQLIRRKDNLMNCNYVAVYEADLGYLNNKSVLILDASTRLFFLQGGDMYQLGADGSSLFVGTWKEEGDTLKLWPLKDLTISFYNDSIFLDSTANQLGESIARDFNEPFTYHRNYSTYLIKGNTLTLIGPPPCCLSGWGTPYPDNKKGPTYYLSSGKPLWDQPKLNKFIKRREKKIKERKEKHNK